MISLVAVKCKKNKTSIKVNGFENLLSGGDLRSLGKSDSIVLKVRDQNNFDELFKFLFHKDSIVVMRAADAIEKITFRHPVYLTKYKNVILELCRFVKNKELKWHIALLIARLNLSGKETGMVWKILVSWATDKEESKIVRVNSIQALYEINRRNEKYSKRFKLLLTEIKEENIPSINARIRKFIYVP